jgi:hypothetical protein
MAAGSLAKIQQGRADIRGPSEPEDTKIPGTQRPDADLAVQRVARSGQHLGERGNCPRKYVRMPLGLFNDAFNCCYELDGQVQIFTINIAYYK